MEPSVKGEPDGEVEDDADHGGGDAGERAVERLVVAQSFDERGAEPRSTESTAQTCTTSRRDRRGSRRASAAIFRGGGRLRGSTQLGGCVPIFGRNGSLPS